MMVVLSNKEAKEDFVTGHDGTAPWEVLLICGTVPIGLWIYQSLPFELLVLLPMLVAQTEYLYPYGLGILAVEVVLAVILPRVMGDRKAVVQAGTRSGPITVYRGGLLWLTIIAILAVDFRVFPRRLVKTEEYGYSLMDLGAASSIAAAGWVGRRPLKWKRVLPLVFMGSLRLLTHKSLEYQEHVSEYGVHWNFFYTLALVPLLAHGFPTRGIVAPTVLLIAYQVLLSHGVHGWILEAPRSCSEYDNLLCHLFVANREGILGCIGYAALFLFAEWLGSLSLKQRRYLLIAVAFLWQSLTAFGHVPSRRSTNAVFIVWVLLVNLLMIGTIEAVYRGRVPYLMEAVNRNGFLCFVIANLLTGAVNLSLDTLHASDSQALVILSVYMVAIALVAVSLDKLNPRKAKEKGS